MFWKTEPVIGVVGHRQILALPQHAHLHLPARDLVGSQDEDDLGAALVARHRRILQAIVYIGDIARKEEFNRAWDQWVDRANPPMRACLGVDLEHPHMVEIVVTAAR